MELSEMQSMCWERRLTAFGSTDCQGILIGKASKYFGFVSKDIDRKEFEQMLEGIVLDLTFD